MHMAEQTHLSNPALRGRLAFDEPMRKHITWRAGGAADRAYAPADLEDAAQFLRSLPEGEPVYFIGLGSNLLVRDGGIRGTVMLMHSSHAAMRMDGALVYAEARADARPQRRTAPARTRGFRHRLPPRRAQGRRTRHARMVCRRLVPFRTRRR